MALTLKDSALFRQQAYINGKWANADSGKTIDVTNPATGEVLGTIPNMGTAETRRAIEAANAAWPAWRKKTAKERAAVLGGEFAIQPARERGTRVTLRLPRAANDTDFWQQI